MVGWNLPLDGGRRKNDWEWKFHLLLFYSSATKTAYFKSVSIMVETVRNDHMVSGSRSMSIMQKNTENFSLHYVWESNIYIKVCHVSTVSSLRPFSNFLSQLIYWVFWLKFSYMINSKISNLCGQQHRALWLVCLQRILNENVGK